MSRKKYLIISLPLLLLAIAYMITPTYNYYLVNNGTTISYSMIKSCFTSKNTTVTFARYVFYSATENEKNYPVTVNNISLVAIYDGATYTAPGVVSKNGTEAYFAYSGAVKNIVIDSITYTPTFDAKGLPVVADHFCVVESIVLVLIMFFEILSVTYVIRLNDAPSS